MTPVERGSRAEQLGRIFLAAVLVAFLPALPFGNFLAYPFAILTTWFHEMGHGLTALVLGQDFQRLVIYSDGSGFAETTMIGIPHPVESAMIAAGGPLGPSVFGAGLILASGWPRLWRPALYFLAAALLVSALIWVRSAIGLVMLPLLAIGIAALALRARDALLRFALQFLGMVAALSMFRDWGYLFSESGYVGGNLMLSDTGAIERNLVMPHWFWAITIMLVSAVLIGGSLKIALAGPAGKSR